MLLEQENTATSLPQGLQFGLLVALASLTPLLVLNQPVLPVLLQIVLGAVVPVQHVAHVTVAPLQLQARQEQEQPLPEQGQHPLLEQVLELATDGQEAEALHRAIFMIKTALIFVVLLTPHVLLERVVIVLLGHALDVPLAHVAARLVLQEQPLQQQEHITVLHTLLKRDFLLEMY